MVQGEAMEKLLCIKTKTTFPGMALLLFGFLAGMIIPNLVYRFTWKQQAFSAVYLLGTYGRTAAYGKEYLYQIIGMRGGMFLLTLLCGFTVFGVTLAVLSMIFTGLGLGMVFVMSILQFGLAGGAVAAGLLLPQYLIYIPVWMKVYGMVYKESRAIWRNHGIFPGKVSSYFLNSLLWTAIFGLGILLEWCINPWILRQILGFINFF